MNAIDGKWIRQKMLPSRFSRGSGYNAFFRKAERLKQKRDIEIRVETIATSGTIIHNKKGETSTERRSAGKNAVIYNTLKKRKRRNPVYLNSGEKGEVQKIITDSVRKYTRDQDPTVMERKLFPAAKKIQETIKKHIENSESEAGGIIKANKKTAYYHIKKALYNETRPLIRTGQLMSSLKPKATVK